MRSKVKTEVAREADISSAIAAATEVNEGPAAAMAVDWESEVNHLAIPKSSVPLSTLAFHLNSQLPVKAPPPGFYGGSVLVPGVQPAMLQRVAGEPMPKQPRRTTMDAIAEPTGSSPSAVVDESKAVPMANSPANSAAGPGPPPIACSVNTVQVNDASAGQPDTDGEGVHTSEDLVPVTPSLLMDNSQD